MHEYNNLLAIILAAGKENLNTEKSLFSYKVCEKELIKRVTEQVQNAGINNILAVVGKKHEQIEKILKDKVVYTNQEESLGTGHAIIKCKDFLKNRKGKVLIMNGNLPLIESKTIEKVLKQSIENEEYATVLTAIKSGANNNFDRVIRNEKNIDIVDKIISDYNEFDINMQYEVNAGIYCFDIEKLYSALDELKPDEEGIYKITDVITYFRRFDLKTGAVIVEDPIEIEALRDIKDLQFVNKIIKNRVNNKLLEKGVIIEDLATTYIAEDVEIGKDTVIHPNTTIKSDVIIGENCEIGPNSYIREGCRLENKVKIGSFVEIKKAIVKYGTKVPHLSYMGDCEIGSNSNIGCGTITCNYDGLNKSKTIIGDRAFIGSNTNLVAPVTLGDNVFVAAGSTITEDVPNYTLAIARQRQVNKEGWNKKA